MTNLAISPTGARVLVEARGEIFTIPAEKGDVRNLSGRAVGRARSGLVPGWQVRFPTSATNRANTNWWSRSQDGFTPPRSIALPHPTHYYTPSWSPDSKKLLYTDTNLKVWVLDVGTGQAKIVGNDPWMVPTRT